MVERTRPSRVKAVQLDDAVQRNGLVQLGRLEGGTRGSRDDADRDGAVPRAARAGPHGALVQPTQVPYASMRKDARVNALARLAAGAVDAEDSRGAETRPTRARWWRRGGAAGGDTGDGEVRIRGGGVAAGAGRAGRGCGWVNEDARLAR